MYQLLMEKYGLRVMFFNGNMDFTIPTVGGRLNSFLMLNYSQFLFVVENYLNILIPEFQNIGRSIWRYNNVDPFAGKLVLILCGL